MRVEMLEQTLIVYALLTAALAARLLWHMFTRLDRFDWRYNEPWWNFALTLIFWPMFLFRPRSFLRMLCVPDFSSSSGYGVDRAARERERDRLRHDLPPCGSHVRYRFRGASGEFTFLADALEELTAEAGGGIDAPEILAWVRNRFRGVDAVSDVPDIWDFESLARRLLEAGCGTVRCDGCGREMAVAALEKSKEAIIRQSVDFWACPCGANAAVSFGAHICTRPGRIMHGAAL